MSKWILGICLISLLAFSACGEQSATDEEYIWGAPSAEEGSKPATKSQLYALEQRINKLETRVRSLEKTVAHHDRFIPRTGSSRDW